MNLFPAILLTAPLFWASAAPLRAQTPASHTTAQQRAALQGAINALDAKTLIELQSATAAYQSALLKGDADAVLAWLAPDFQLGNLQYRPRVLA